MNITLVEPDGVGGLAHFSYEMSRALAAYGHRVRLITSRHYELAHLPHNFEVVSMMRLWAPSVNSARSRMPAMLRKLRRVKRGVRLTWEWGRVTRMLLAEHADIVLFSEVLFPHLSVFLWYLNKRGVRLGQICHEFAYQEREGRNGAVSRLAKSFDRLIYPQFHRIFFLSESTRKSFHERFSYPTSRTLRIPHGSQSVFPPAIRSRAEFCTELAIPADKPVILFFGGLRPSKGVPDLIDAFARSSWRDKARLVVVGQPAGFMDMKELTEAIARNDLADRVVLRTGYIPLEDVSSYFDAASAVVLPYRSATQSGVLHLAYELARPVIATRVGGLAEDVRDGHSGYLVEPGNIDQMADRIDAMFDDPAAAAEMGRRGRELSRTEFTWTSAARIIAASFADGGVPAPHADPGRPG
jgi:glycosyltransferase involved in cell wall biosynthesis